MLSALHALILFGQARAQQIDTFHRDHVAALVIGLDIVLGLHIVENKCG